ncbi:MAG: MFS transporter [Candidatus Delongbacteria bacterium]|nr:MFS transporter [Candidatus Delongbacteria bacterium]MBN2834651.1 MFS transporter [Candidatus Delongbacteria bacterium]
MQIFTYIKVFLKRNYPAFRHQNYRLYWLGQTVSVTGTWMQTIAQSWLVYKLTDSPFLMGLVGAAQFTPVLIFSLFAGVYLDRIPKKNLLLFTQFSMMILAFIMTGLVFFQTVQYWHILILATLLGVANTMDMPARQTFMMELVGKNHLTSAIALNSVTFNLARIVGPSLAGLLMAYFNIEICFLINGLSFIVVIYFLVRMKTEKIVVKVKEKVTRQIKDGLKYVFADKLLMKSVTLLFVVGTLAVNYGILIPVYTKEVLSADAQVYGFLMSGLGLGAISGGLFISAKSEILNRKFILNVFPFMISVSLFIIGFSTNFYLTFSLLFLNGVFNIFFFNTVNTTLQINSKAEYRGRVMSIYTMVFAGSTPFGNLIAGSLSDVVNIEAGFIGCAVLIAVFSLLIHKKIENS